MLSLAFLTAAALAPPQVDVIIVGAGWAGMAAADWLARANVSFLVLESTDHTGGRTHSIPFGHPDVWTGVIERGSNWVSGAGGGAAGVMEQAPTLPIENPVRKLARQERLQMVRIPGGSDSNMSLYEAVYTSSGDPNGDPGGQIRTKATRVLDCLNATAPQAGINASVRDGLQACGWEPQSEEEWAVDWAMSGEDLNGEPARGQSLVDFTPDESYVWWGPDEFFVVDQHPRGFARLIDGLVRETIPAGDPRLVYNARVTRIAYDCEGVTVTTQDSRRFHAQQVISTLPLGVLQRNHSQLFDPPLPKRHVDVLTSRGIGMGNLTHVAVQFPDVWWDDGLFKWLSANHGANQSARRGASGEFAVWHNLNHASLLPGSQTLLSFLGDPQSSRYEGMADADVQEAVLGRLREQHPERHVPEPTALFISRHGYDPNSYGAYSYFMPGWSDRFYSTLKKPLKASCSAGQSELRVRFAGEAMCDNLAGYTHGGYQSGLEAAAHYLYDEGKGPNPQTLDHLCLCDW